VSVRPKIIYFDIRGRAETIRLLFEELGEPYDEHRLRSPEEWAAMKPETPFGALPIYQEGDLEFAQTQAIYRHIARTRGLYGKSEREHIECDVAEEAINEAIGNLWQVFWQRDYAAQLPTFAAGPFGGVLKNLERWFTRASPTPRFWVGDALTYVDAFAFRLLDEVEALVPRGLDATPALRTFHRAYAARPRAAAYIASGRRPAAFGYGIDGPVRDQRGRGGV